MAILLGTVFIASLLGSLHCVGMCGPFAMLAAAGPETRRGAWPAAAAYSAGRLATYSVVGLAAGSFGMLINQTANQWGPDSWSGMQQTATWLAGLIMVVVGSIALLRQAGVRVPLPAAAGPLQGLLTRSFAWVQDQHGFRKALLIGGLTCLMPCGWLYTFAVVAAGTGSPWWGLAVMLVFWSGTVPILTGLILGAGKLQASWGRRVPVLMAGLVVGIGVFTMAYRAPVQLNRSTMGGVSISSGTQESATAAKTVAPVDWEQLTQQVERVDASKLPCCESGGGE